ncbi:MAG: ribosome biogenesis GTPase Der [Fimbriimonadaceae bacterium]|nr:ribosome biogenesis GTPase Der [Fimbriimonadaceae bacterium]
MAAKLPTIVIVGRPNVGKSTLFNRIIGERIAVVQDEPGVTRDRLYGEFIHKGRRMRLVDTGGILFGDDDPLVEQIKVQAEVAMAEADAIIFLTDADQGVIGGDEDLAALLRRQKIPIAVFANKVDGPQREPQAAEFFRLGVGEVFAVSALHGTGIEDGLDFLTQDFPAVKVGEEPEDELRLAILGRPNVGKSSMLNAFTGEQRVIVSDIPGTTRDAIDSLVSWKGQSVRLIDTAGIRRRGKIQGSIEYYMVLRASRALERAECALLVIDGDEGLTDGDKRVAHAAHELGKPLVIAVNKWDLVEPPDGNLGRSSPEKKEMLKEIRNHLPESGYAPVRFTSAKESRGMDGIMNAVNASVANWHNRIPTGPLNRLIQDATFDRPLTRKGKPFRIKYATQPSICPPTIILFCNDADLMHFSYQRYIENKIRETFSLEGTPIRLLARSTSRRDGDFD